MIGFNSPQNCVWFLFLDWHPPPAGPPPPPRPLCHIQLFHTQLCHIQIGHAQLCHTHNFVTQLCHTHTTLSHTHNFVTHTHNFVTQVCHTQLCHTQLCHTHTQNFVTHTHLCHTHTQLGHTHTHNFVTHNFVTHNFVTHTTLSHTHTHNFVTHTHTFVTHTALSHTTLSHTTCHIQILTYKLSCRGPFFVAGVALRDLLRRFTWHAWHLATSTFVLRRRRGTYGTGLGLVTRLGAVCSRGPLAWQAWRCVTSFVVARGRRGTWRHPPFFAWQARYLWDWAGSCDALGRRVLPWPFGVAGVALRDILRRCTWQAWHLATSTFVLRGRRGTYGTVLCLVTRLGAVCSRPFFVAGVALFVTSSVVSRGRRGVWRHPPSFFVAGVVLMGLGWLWWRVGDSCLRFPWQGWRLVTSTSVLRGRPSTYWHTHITL